MKITVSGKCVFVLSVLTIKITCPIANEWKIRDLCDKLRHLHHQLGRGLRWCQMRSDYGFGTWSNFWHFLMASNKSDVLFCGVFRIFLWASKNFINLCRHLMGDGDSGWLKNGYNFIYNWNLCSTQNVWVKQRNTKKVYLELFFFVFN